MICLKKNQAIYREGNLFLFFYDCATSRTLFCGERKQCDSQAQSARRSEWSVSSAGTRPGRQTAFNAVVVAMDLSNRHGMAHRGDSSNRFTPGPTEI
jgi:hypothetical protein